jgi:nicotinamide riboside kinase
MGVVTRVESIDPYFGRQVASRQLTVEIKRRQYAPALPARLVSQGTGAETCTNVYGEVAVPCAVLPPVASTGLKIAFIGSHSIRKTNAVHSFAGAVGRSGRSVEVGREVIRHNPLGLNEGATPEAQLWVLMTQVQQELELRNRADVLVTDRAIIDNFAYFLRATGGADPFDVKPFVVRWCDTYDLMVRILPDIPLREDGVRSTSERFRSDIEQILDIVVPSHVDVDRLITIRASEVTEAFEWNAILERLVGPIAAEAAVPHRVTSFPTLWD